MKFHLVHIVPTERHHGMHGYREIAETVQWGLRELGHEATLALNQFASDAVNIVFGAQVLTEEGLNGLPPDSIVYHLEQFRGIRASDIRPGTHGAVARFRFWEYSAANLPTFKLLKCKYEPVLVPVGWAPILERIPEAAAPDIDVLFYGLTNELRLSIFHALCTEGLRCVYACGLYGAARDDLISRAKLVLNLNMYAFSRIFEVVRVSYLLANAKAVVSDIHPDSFIEEDMKGALAFAPPEQIVSTCLGLLQNEAQRRQLAERGREIFRQRDIRGILRQALAASGIA
jgi:hypothetical protein